MSNIRKAFAVILATLVLAVAVTSLLVIWEVIQIDVEMVLKRSFYSLFVVFIAGALILFIFNVLFKEDKKVRPPKQPPIG